MDHSEYVRSESHALAEPNEALPRLSQGMTRVLEILIAPKASIDMVRRHGAEEFLGINMEEFDKEEFWLESYKEYWRKLDALPIREYHMQPPYCRVRHMIGGS